MMMRENRCLSESSGRGEEEEEEEEEDGVRRVRNPKSKTFDMSSPEVMMILS